MIRLDNSALPRPGARILVREQGLSIIVFNVDGQLYALDDDCPHRAGSLFAGKLEHMLLSCPAHSLQFDIRSGCMRGGGDMRARCYRVTQAADHVLIALSDTPA